MLGRFFFECVLIVERDDDCREHKAFTSYYEPHVPPQYGGLFCHRPPGLQSFGMKFGLGARYEQRVKGEKIRASVGRFPGEEEINGSVFSPFISMLMSYQTA